MFSILLLLAMSLSQCVGDCQVPFYDSFEDCKDVCSVAYGAIASEANPMWWGQCSKDKNFTDDTDDNCYWCPCTHNEADCTKWAEEDKSVRECQRSEATSCILECYKDESSCEDNCGDPNYDCHQGKGTERPCHLCLQREPMYWGDFILVQWWFWLIIVICLGLIVAGVVILIYCCCCRKNEQ